LDKVKGCFDTYQIDQKIIDAIITNLELIQDIYPYVDVARNPPQNMQRRNPVNYATALATLKNTLAQSNRLASKVFPATMKFISSFHDGHFSMTVFENEVANMLAEVAGVLPFLWSYAPDDNGVFHVRIAAKMPNYFLDNATQNLMSEKYWDESVTVTSIDNQDPLEFLGGFFGEYNEMKSLQGSLALSQLMENSGFWLYNYPSDNVFKNHTIRYSDGTQIVFHTGFINAANTRKRGLDEGIFNPKTFVTLNQEMKVMKELMKQKQEKGKVQTEAPSKAVRDSGILCGATNGFNYVRVETFGSDPDVFARTVKSCAAYFDNNDYPIAIIFPVNGGGYGVSEAVLFQAFMPNADNRYLAAIRKTDTNYNITMDPEYGYVYSFSDYDGNNCYDYQYNRIGTFWEESVIDNLGNGVTHNRTKKTYIAQKNYLYDTFTNAMKKNIRKPTDIVVVTDGYCFSACSLFVNNVIRAGSAIVTGMGPTYPNDTRFVAAQCPSSVISPEGMFEEADDNNKLGLQFTTTFFETYNISEKKDEIYPGDYDTLRIDKHLGLYEYFSSRDVETSEIIKYVKVVHEEFKTKCNPANKRLFMVTDNCTVSDEHALDVGYPCGSNGEWDRSQCKISTCDQGYVVDFENNKCVPNKCDYRHSVNPGPQPEPPQPASSCIVRPIIGLFSFVLLALFFLIH